MTTRTVTYLVVIFTGIYLFFKYAVGYVLPFVVGVFLAFLLEPVVSAISRKLHIKQAFAGFLTLMVLLGSLSYLFTWAVTRIIRELTELYKVLPSYYEEFNRIIVEVLQIAGDISEKLPEPLARIVQDFWNQLYELISSIVTGAGGVVWGVPGVTIMIFVTVLTAYFVIRDRVVLGQFIRSILPTNTYNKFKSVQVDVISGIAGFVRAQILLVFLTMIVNVVMLILLGFRYAVALGLCLALLDILPVIGPGLIYLPWITYHIIWGEMSLALALIVLYGAVSFLRQIAQTHLVGKEMGFHPLVTLMSLYIGIRFFGPLGFIYGPMTAIIIKGLWVSGFIPHEGGAQN